MSLPVAMSQVPTAKNTAGTAAALRPQKNISKKRRQARCARRMYVGKIKYRDQHRAEDQANTSDRGGGAEHMTNTLDRGVLRPSDHAEDPGRTR